VVGNFILCAVYRVWSKFEGVIGKLISLGFINGSETGRLGGVRFYTKDEMHDVRLGNVVVLWDPCADNHIGHPVPFFKAKHHSDQIATE